MKVSIITPAYNCENYVAESIESILNQTYENWELLIGDDGSTDNTRHIIDSYRDNRIKRFHCKRNMGVLRMFNKLLECATGDFMMSHDADDISAPSRIEAQLQVFKKFPNIGICGTNGMIFGLKTDARLANDSMISSILPKDYTGLPFFPASIMYRREVYKEIGGWNIFFDRLSSMDQYWIYLMTEKFPTYYLAEPLYWARMHATSNHRAVNMKDIKKLASWDIYKMLRQQRVQTGTDSLEKNDLAAIDAFVMKLANNRHWMAEKYREYSAIRCDVGDVSNALRLGVKAVWTYPLALTNYRTLLYALRKRLRT